MTALTARQFTEETAAVAHVEASRWADGVTCPHCGSVNVRRMEGKTQAGYFLCNDCRDKFTCRTGTVMERSHIPVHKWLLAIHLMSTAKNGMSAHELHRNLGITYKSAWFLAHRIRKAMDDDKTTPIGGEGGQVQADEAFIGSTSKRAKNYDKSRKNKNGIVAIVDPQTGEVRAKALKLMPHTANVREFLVANTDRKSTLVTDEAKLYIHTGKEYAAHETVNHSLNEYKNKRGYSTNNVENFFLQFKRNARHLHSRREAALAALSERIFLPLFKPFRPRNWRRGACGARA
jgi:transposase-like protein